MRLTPRRPKALSRRPQYVAAANRIKKKITWFVIDLCRGVFVRGMLPNRYIEQQNCCLSGSLFLTLNPQLCLVQQWFNGILRFIIKGEKATELSPSFFEPSDRPGSCQRCHVDHETIFHIALQQPFVGFIDFLDRDLFDIGRYPVLAAEIQHLLCLLHAADQ